MRADQTAFATERECTSYAAKGGTLTVPKSASQLLCESYTGTFAAGTTPILWTCNYWWSPDYFGAVDAMSSQCYADALPVLRVQLSGGTEQLTCNVY